mgnify:CR=1 FL=1
MSQAQRRAPWRWIVEVVIVAADELHTFYPYRWISRKLMGSNSCRLVWIFAALLVRRSSHTIIDLHFSATSLQLYTRPLCAIVLVPKITSELQSRVLLAAQFKMPFLSEKNACEMANFNRENLRFWNLEFWKVNNKQQNNFASSAL